MENTSDNPPPKGWQAFPAFPRSRGHRKAPRRSLHTQSPDASPDTHTVLPAVPADRYRPHPFLRYRFPGPAQYSRSEPTQARGSQDPVVCGVRDPDSFPQDRTLSSLSPDFRCCRPESDGFSHLRNIPLLKPLPPPHPTRRPKSETPDPAWSVPAPNPLPVLIAARPSGYRPP